MYSNFSPYFLTVLHGFEQDSHLTSNTLLIIAECMHAVCASVILPKHAVARTVRAVAVRALGIVHCFNFTLPTTAVTVSWQSKLLSLQLTAHAERESAALSQIHFKLPRHHCFLPTSCYTHKERGQKATLAYSCKNPTTCKANMTKVAIAIKPQQPPAMPHSSHATTGSALHFHDDWDAKRQHHHQVSTLPQSEPFLVSNEAKTQG
jgi:hypothetical protein